MANKKKPDVRVCIEPDQEPMAVEIMEQSIVAIADSMRAINKTRLTRNAIVVLIAANSKLGKGTIEIVLNNLEALEEIYLKPREKKS